MYIYISVVVMGKLAVVITSLQESIYIVGTCILYKLGDW